MAVLRECQYCGKTICDIPWHPDCRLAALEAELAQVESRLIDRDWMLDRSEERLAGARAALRELPKAILDDVTDRRGWRQEWDMMDPDIQQEIKDAWDALAAAAIKAAEEAQDE